MLRNRQGDRVTRICDDCGDEKEVTYWNVYKKEKHQCKHCALQGVNKGKPSWNKGKKMPPKHIGNTYMHSDGYPQVWVGKDVSTCGYKGVHRVVVADMIGRDLTTKEKVHHINGIRDDYRPINLFLCDNMSHHRHVHAQLERVSMKLVQNNIIKFNKEKGEYELSRIMEEFMNEKLGELLETPNEKDEGNQQPSSEELKEMVQRLFRKEVHQ